MARRSRGAHYSPGRYDTAERSNRRQGDRYRPSPDPKDCPYPQNSVGNLSSEVVDTSISERSSKRRRRCGGATGDAQNFVEVTSGGFNGRQKAGNALEDPQRKYKLPKAECKRLRIANLESKVYLLEQELANINPLVSRQERQVKQNSLAECFADLQVERNWLARNRVAMRYDQVRFRERKHAERRIREIRNLLQKAL